MKHSQSDSPKMLRRHMLPLLFALTMALPLGSCSTFTVQSVQTPKTDDIISKTAVAYFWGVSDPDLKAQCEGQGLEFVAMQTNFLYNLCSVVTLGIITPIEVQYRCAGRQLQEGSGFGSNPGGTP